MNLREALEAADVEIHPGATEEEIWICCPFCTDRGETPDTRFRLGVNMRTGQAHCFNCSWRARGDYTFNRLQRALATGEIQAAEDIRSKKRHHKKVKLPVDFEPLLPLTHDSWHRMAYNYVRKRNVSDHQIKDKKIGYSLVDDNDDDGTNMAYRVIFPVYIGDKLKGLVGRDFTGKQTIPYKNSVGGKALYNLPTRPQKTASLQEGVFDTLVVAHAIRHMEIDSLGLLGHDLTDDQLALLEPYKRIFLWLDPDKAGVEGLIGKHNNGGIYKKLRDAHKIVHYILPHGFLEGKKFDKRDPSEYESHEIRKRFEHAHRMTDETVDRLAYWKAFIND